MAGDVAAHGERPGVVGRRRRQPDDLVGVVIELLRQLIALVDVLPGGVIGLVEEEAGIAGIFGIDVDFACGDRLAHDRCRAKRDAVLRLDAVRFESERNDVAEQRAFRVDLRRNDDVGGMGRTHCKGGERNGKCEFLQHGISPC